MDVLDDSRVTRGNDNHYWVTISHGQYLVACSYLDGSWRAHDDAGGRIGDACSTDPLVCSSDACAPWATAQEIVSVLLAFDGQAVPA